jgi:thiamine biosynthesis lipoprotein ApbE
LSPKETQPKKNHLVTSQLKCKTREQGKDTESCKRKNMPTYTKGKPIRITSDTNHKSQKTQDNIFQALRENNCQQKYSIQKSYPSFLMKKKRPSSIRIS